MRQNQGFPRGCRAASPLGPCQNEKEEEEEEEEEGEGDMDRWIE